MNTRREFLATAIAVPLAGAEAAGKVYWNRPPLAENRYAPLPLGSIKPQGWLRDQLRTQADGLTGHLDEFWPDLGPASGWLGGAGESWERGPYYMDGLVPLAFLLDDEKLIAKAKKWTGWTLANQRPDGAIGPDPNRGKYAAQWQAADWWPNMVMLKALTQYQEATGDARVIPLMSSYFRHHLENAAKVPLVRWASYRWIEEVLSIIWLYNRTGDQALLNLARILEKQSFDWKAHFADFKYTGKVERSQTGLHTHVVNNAMAIKTSAVWWQISREESDRQAIYRLLEVMDRHHGMPNGVHSGDEHYAGLDPSQGTELCAVVEGMFSLETAMAVLGDAAFGDRLERMTYNALPATFKSDMWAHQYDQQVNQVLCTRDKSRRWTTNGPDSNIFGLEPNFGCCTSNMHQGWPKFVAHLWMATRQGGLAAVAYGPSHVTTGVAGGVKVAVAEETEYPFREAIKLVVRPERPARFPLELRVPAWAQGAGIKIRGRAEAGVKPGTFHLIDREWKDGDTVELRFPMPVRTERHYRNSLVLLRGPLVFALKVGEDWRKLKGEEPHADWEVYPTTPWNYALSAEKPVRVDVKPVGKVPYSPEGAPVLLRAKARQAPEWKLEAAAAGPLPETPVSSAEPEETVTLIPYGSAKLRVSAFPTLKR